jgi:hypothetical protein
MSIDGIAVKNEKWYLMLFIIILESKTLFCLKTQACVDIANIV